MWKFDYAQVLASFPGPRPASHHLYYGKVRDGLVNLITWIRHNWQIAEQKGNISLVVQSTIQFVAPHWLGTCGKLTGTFVVLAVPWPSAPTHNWSLSTLDITHVMKCTRPSPTFPYCKQQEAGWRPGNEATHLRIPRPEKELLRAIPCCIMA